MIENEKNSDHALDQAVSSYVPCCAAKLASSLKRSETSNFGGRSTSLEQLNFHQNEIYAYEF